MVACPLYLDSGNSRLKWCYGQRRGVFANGLELHSFIRDQNVAQVVLATVTETYTVSSIQNLSPGIAIHNIKVIDRYLGLVLAYSDITTLGVDRWLNMLAVINQPKPVINIVVSMGTAMTIDVIDSNKMHLGGYIIPGLRAQSSSLNQSTAALPVTNIGYKTSLGVNTEQCISQGILKSCTALVESLVVQDGEVPELITVTGGDGAYLSESLSVDHQYCESLIFKGMQVYWEARTNTLR
jgi:type III pantothenate kinase